MKEDEIEELVEQKVEEKINEKSGETGEENKDKEELDRRGFLKKAGIGMAGLGALALNPVSALDLRSNDFRFFNQRSGGLQLEMESDGTLDLQGNEIKNSPSIGGGGISNPLTEDLDLGGNNLVSEGSNVLEFSSSDIILNDKAGSPAFYMGDNEIEWGLGRFDFNNTTVHNLSYDTDSVSGGAGGSSLGSIIVCSPESSGSTLSLSGSVSGKVKRIINKNGNPLRITDQNGTINGKDNIILSRSHAAVVLITLAPHEWYIAASHEHTPSLQ